MGTRQSRLRELVLLAAACGFFFFFRLSAIGLIGPDEPRYAQVAREMLERGDWVTPVLYHHTWLEKPILLYWGEMLSYRLFGVSDWAARLPASCAATLLVVGSYLAVRRLHRPAALDAALMVASSVLVLGFARAAATDMLLASPWGLSLLAWFCWYALSHQSGAQSGADLQRPEHVDSMAATRDKKLLLSLFYAFNALAMLAKGPVAPALAALVLTAFCIAERNPGALVRSVDPLGILLFVAVAAPWYVLVQLRTPEFFRIFFLEHNLARFGSNLYRHKQPFWYYLPVALVAALPWTVWMLHGAADGFAALRPQKRRSQPSAVNAPFGLERVLFDRKRFGRGPKVQVVPSAEESSAGELIGEGPSEPFSLELFLLLWALVPILFFSLSRSKLPGYILPSVPALAILASIAVHRRAARAERPWPLSIAIHAVLLSVLAAAACVAPRLMLRLPLTTSSLMLAALAGTATFMLVALGLLLAGWRWLRFATLLPVILIVGFVLRGLAPTIDATQSARPVAELLMTTEERPVALPHPASQSVLRHNFESPVATFGLNRNMAFGLGFYLNRRVDRYEGLEISPAVYELPPAVPPGGHLLVVRDSSFQAVRLLLAGRKLVYLASYGPQHLQVYQVAAAR